MDWTKLIDDEDIVLDSQKLKEFHRSSKLKNDINKVIDDYICERCGFYDYEKADLLMILKNRINKVLDGQ